MFNILQEILQSRPVFLCHKSSKRRDASGAESKGLNIIFAKKGKTIIVKQGLVHLVITSRSSHFFNKKIDFEQYLFKCN